MLFQLPADERSDVRIDGWQHLVELLHLRYGKTAGDQGIGHFEPDVAGADDERSRWCPLLKRAHDGERVAHGVEQMHAVSGAERIGSLEPGNRRTNRHGAGTDDELVVRQRLLDIVVVRDEEPAVARVDTTRDSPEAQLHAGSLEVGNAAVCEIAPVSDLSGDVIRNPADREIGIRVGDDDGDL